MIKKITSLFVCSVLILLCLTSCGSSGTGKKIVTPIDSEPEYLDPQIVSQTGAKTIVLNCFEGLVTFDENGAIVPAAAESYSVSDDGLTYTFSLRKDGSWKLTTAAQTVLGEEAAKSFDTTVTAKDFVFALRRALQPETLCPYAESLFNIKNAIKVNNGSLSSTKLGVKADGDFRLVITLEKKDADFLSVLTMPACMPCNEEFFEATKGRYGLTTDYLIYNGPFYISNWAENTAITLRRNSSYHSLGDDEIANEVKPSSVYFSFNSEQSTRGTKVKEGTYDLAPLTSEQAAELSQNSKLTVTSYNSALTSLIFNCSDEIMQQLQIRMAMSYALDTSVFLESFDKSVATGVVPSACLLKSDSYRSKAKSFNTNPTDTKKAVKLLNEGMQELDVSDIELTILCLQENETVVRSAMQQWQSAFGVSFGISVEVLDADTLKSRVESGDYQIALYDLKFEDITAEKAISCFKSGSRYNITNLSDESFDSIITKLAKTGGISNTVSVIEEAEAYLISCAVLIPICETEVYYGFAKGVSGIVLSPTGETAYFKTAIRK